MIKKDNSYYIYVLRAIAGLDRSNRHKYEFTLPRNLVYLEKNDLNISIFRDGYASYKTSGQSATYHYKCKITPKLRENVKQILDKIAA